MLACLLNFNFFTLVEYRIQIYFIFTLLNIHFIFNLLFSWANYGLFCIMNVLILKNLSVSCTVDLNITIFILYIELYGNTNWHALTKKSGNPWFREYTQHWYSIYRKFSECSFRSKSIRTLRRSFLWQSEPFICNYKLLLFEPSWKAL